MEECEAELGQLLQVYGYYAANVACQLHDSLLKLAKHAIDLSEASLLPFVKEEKLLGVPLLVLANKQDLISALSADEVCGIHVEDAKAEQFLECAMD